MRTGLVTATLRKTGETVLLAGHPKPLSQLRNEFKAAFAGKTAHPEYSEVQVWESSTGVVLRRRFRSPEEEAKRVANNVAVLESLDPETAPEDPAAPPAPEPTPPPPAAPAAPAEKAKRNR